jgi:hypothetical protein
VLGAARIECAEHLGHARRLAAWLDAREADSPSRPFHFRRATLRRVVVRAGALAVAHGLRIRSLDPATVRNAPSRWVRVVERPSKGEIPS